MYRMYGEMWQSVAKCGSTSDRAFGRCSIQQIRLRQKQRPLVDKTD